MVVEKRKSGISLISLIITIIVIIILAAIVIFSGMDTPEKAQLSKVISDIDNVQTAVDQAYYGLYTEKAVAGEVWTPSQFYEAVAKGITNRDDLSGDTGIIEIQNRSLLAINLPEYEGRKWGLALEDLGETVKIGSVLLIPGFVSNGKTYATLLDVQSGGSDGNGANGGNQGGLTEEDKELLAQIQLGDYVNYMDSNVLTSSSLFVWNGTNYNSNYDKGDKLYWRIVNKNQMGDIFIILEGGDKEIDLSEVDFVNRVKELNNFCKENYTGKGAIEVRNMSLEDFIEFKEHMDIKYGMNTSQDITDLKNNEDERKRYAVYSADTPDELVVEKKVICSNGKEVIYEPLKLNTDVDLQVLVYDDFNGNTYAANKRVESLEFGDGGYKVPKYVNGIAMPVLINKKSPKYYGHYMIDSYDVMDELSDIFGYNYDDAHFLTEPFCSYLGKTEIENSLAYLKVDIGALFNIEYKNIMLYTNRKFATPIVKINISSLEKVGDVNGSFTRNVWNIK